MSPTPKYNKRKIYGSLLKKYNFTFFNLCLANVCALISLIFPLFFKLLIDIAFYEHNYEVFIRLTAGIMVLLLYKFIVDLIVDLSFNYMSYNFSTNLASMVYNKIFRLKPDNIIKSSVGEFINRINNETSQFWFAFLFWEIFCIVPIVKISVSTIFISLVNIKTVIILLIGIPLNLLVSNRFSKKTVKYQEKFVRNSAIFSGWIYNVLNGAREIILLSAQSFIIRRMTKKNKELIYEKIRIAWKEFVGKFAADSIYLIMLLVIYCVNVHDIIENKLSLGAFISITMYLSVIKEQSTLLTQFIFNIRECNVSIQRILDFMNQKEEALEEGLVFPDYIDSIEFEKVCFSYDKTCIFKDLNLKINRGEKIAIVGKSGMGKSTLLSLLLRFNDPDSGRILINNEDIKKYSLSSLRRKIGIVFQTPYLFENTIRYNIENNDYKESDEQLYSLLHAVSMDEFVKKLPDALDYRIGKDVDKFSLGQMQRIVFARVLNKNPLIYLFDEATASLDSESELILNQTVSNINKEHIVISVSHRLSSVRNYDKVALLKKGCIMEYAPYNELIVKSKDFNELMFN